MNTSFGTKRLPCKATQSNALALPSPHVIPIDPTHICIEGKVYLNFSGCDVFRMGFNEQTREAIAQSSISNGVGLSGTRSAVANHPLLKQLEVRLAEFLRQPAACVFSSLYLANISIMQIASQAYSHIIADSSSHISLVDAISFFKGPVLKFDHLSPASLRTLRQSLPSNASVLIVTDALFGGDGEIPPVNEYLKLMKSSDRILLDEAHSFGVLGKLGLGLAEEWGLIGDKRIIHAITFSKALGCYGGAIVCSEEVAGLIKQSAHPYFGNTPLPLPLVSGALKALEVMSRAVNWRRCLNTKCKDVHNMFKRLGLKVPKSISPYFPLITESEHETMKLTKCLESSGIFPPRITYPGVGRRGFFRFTVSSQHNREDLRRLNRALALWRMGN